MRVGRDRARYRTVLISDLHLGSYRCDARAVLDFLRTHQSDTLFLVGDVVDLWCMRRSGGWPAAHVAVIRLILERARSGTRVVIVPGNHDGPLLNLAGLGLEGIEVAEKALFKTAQGQRLLVTHGHEADRVFGSTHGLASLLYAIGESVCEVLDQLGVRFTRRRKPYDAPTQFERVLAASAAELGLDGVVCGHNHRPADRMIDGVRYLNCGDWLGNCTGIVEERDGSLRLLRWRETAIEAQAEPSEPFGLDVPAGALP